MPLELNGRRVSSALGRPRGLRVAGSRVGWLFAAALSVAAAGACSGVGESPDGAVGAAASADSSCTPVRLALKIESGVAVPLQVRAGQTFYVNQIDLRASLTTSVDEGLASLEQSGDFAGLPWDGLEQTDTDVSGTPNPDGTFNRRRYYRSAHWMKKKSKLTLEQLDAQGKRRGQPVELHLGRADQQGDDDSFFVRRLAGIQWTQDCVSPTDCTGATSFEEEALVQVRDALDNNTPFQIDAATTSLRLTWSLRPGPGWIIPVTQVASPAYDYGFSIDIAVLTPPGPNGSYPPDSDVTFQATLRDGSGNRLFPPGTLPSFFDAEVIGDPTGVRYYGGFFDPSIIYYRHKHTEGMMMEQLIGPVQDVQPIRTVLEVPDLLTDVQNPALPSRDGFYGSVVMFPRGTELFGGAFDPTHAGWFQPVSDTWTQHIAPDAKPGTYLATMKGRRAYLGEDLPFTRTIEIRVGSPTPTSPKLDIGHCDSCHVGGGSFANINHDNPNLGACTACHTPLAIEMGGPVYVRTHFLHSRSGRFDAPLTRCANCHLSKEGIQRTSKSACLSCHTSYPQSHVQQYGPITDPFVGDDATAFPQCSTTCHLTHPDSGLN